MLLNTLSHLWCSFQRSAVPKSQSISLLKMRLFGGSSSLKEINPGHGIALSSPECAGSSMCFPKSSETGPEVLLRAYPSWQGSPQALGTCIRH